jgi:hypothetical protein
MSVEAEMSDDDLFADDFNKDIPEPTPEPEPAIDQTLSDYDDPVPSTPVEAVAEEVVPGEPNPAPAGDVDADEPANVPSWRLRESTEGRIAAETAQRATEAELAQTRFQLQQIQQQQSSQQQPAPEVPDVFEDPIGYTEYMQQQVREVAISSNDQMQEFKAGELYTPKIRNEAWTAALAAAPGNTALANRIGNAPNPYAEAVIWHREVENQKVIGDDGIEAHNARVIAAHEAAKLTDNIDPNVAQPGGVVAQTQRAIPSLNGAASANRQTQKLAVTDDELFNS